MNYLEVEMSWVGVDRARWRWLHGLLIPMFYNKFVEANIDKSHLIAMTVAYPLIPAKKNSNRNNRNNNRS